MIHLHPKLNLLLPIHLQVLTSHDIYMHRCLQLAQLGVGNVAPNPMVGAVLVFRDRVIGEGYHQQYGGPHAEVNCIDSVLPESRELIRESTLYVSLEPCAHFGKTPPCADLILQHKIKSVVIGCRDPFVAVDGKGIEKLQAAGVQVTTGILEDDCKKINKHFLTFHTQHRPFIFLKWAQTGNGYMNQGDQSRLLITNAFTNRLVHQWRSQHMAILVGTNTALLDDPELTTRLWPGKNPLRLVLDMNLRLPRSLKLFNDSTPTIVFNKHQHTIDDLKKARFEFGLQYYQVSDDVSFVHQFTHALYQMNIQSVMVEGGAQLLLSFIDAELWDEASVITNESLMVQQGLPAPVLKQCKLSKSKQLGSDHIRTYQNLFN